MKIIDLEEYRAKKRKRGIVIYISAVDAKAFDKRVKEKPGSIVDIIRDAIKGK